MNLTAEASRFPAVTFRLLASAEGDEVVVSRGSTCPNMTLQNVATPIIVWNNHFIADVLIQTPSSCQDRLPIWLAWDRFPPRGGAMADCIGWG